MTNSQCYACGKERKRLHEHMQHYFCTTCYNAYFADQGQEVREKDGAETLSSVTQTNLGGVAMRHLDVDVHTPEINHVVKHTYALLEQILEVTCITLKTAEYYELYILTLMTNGLVCIDGDNVYPTSKAYRIMQHIEQV